MEYILKETEERTWTIRLKEKGSDLSESEVKVIESGFPNKWLVIYENAYGKLSIKRMDRDKLIKAFGIAPE